MMRLVGCALIAAALAGPAIAQSVALPPPAAAPAEQLLTANGVTARCMARTTTQSEHPNWSFVVPVPPGKQADFAAKGFMPAPCAGMTVNLARFKKDSCELAKGNEAVQRRTEQVFGIDARKTCAAITLLVPDSAADQAN